MKPEKAISIINDYDVYFEGHTAEEIVDAMELAIEALQKQIPKPVEETHVLRTETHAVRSDTISRQDAIDAANRADYRGLAVEDVRLVTDEVVKELKRLPSAQPKTGKWIENSPVTMKCDQCGLVIKDWDCHRFKYCPNCGARMLNGGEK